MRINSEKLQGSTFLLLLWSAKFFHRQLSCYKKYFSKCCPSHEIQTYIRNNIEIIFQKHVTS